MTTEAYLWDENNNFGYFEVYYDDDGNEVGRKYFTRDELKDAKD